MPTHGKGDSLLSGWSVFLTEERHSRLVSDMEMDFSIQTLGHAMTTIASVTNTRFARPEYEHPPLTSVSLSVSWSDDVLSPRFADEFSQRMGPLWRLIKGEMESSEPASQARFVFQSPVEDRTLTLIRNSFTYTWRADHVAPYPRYEALRDGFLEAWNILRLPEPYKSQLAFNVQYINEIPQGTVWKRFGSWDFCTLLQGMPLFSNPPLCALHSRWAFELPEALGELRINVDCESHAADSPGILFFTLNVAGDVPASDEVTPELLRCFDFSRDHIVSAFQKFTSPDAHLFWGVRPVERRAVPRANSGS